MIRVATSVWEFLISCVILRCGVVAFNVAVTVQSLRITVTSLVSSRQYSSCKVNELEAMSAHYHRLQML